MRKRNLFFIAVLLVVGFLFMGCHVRVDPSPTGVVYYTGAVPGPYVVDPDGAVCYEEPYWHEPLWCDYYDDYSACCVWYIDGWHEEWCSWDYEWGCWEYIGGW
tara:strand:- start:64 stop:372 length:309 start_codon:yes stop_codon:yes gene_type:complete